MSWLNSFKKESPLGKLSTSIFNNSLFCAEALKLDLEKKFGKNSKEFNLKYFLVLCEFIYFFLHLVNRSAFEQLGHKKRIKLQKTLGPLVVNPVIESLFGHWPINLKDGIKKDFYNNLNRTELDYGDCKKLFLKPEDDTPPKEKIAAGIASKSIVGKLIDNLSQIIVGKVNTDLFFTMKIWKILIEVLKRKEIDGLVLEVSKEIEKL